MTFAAGQVLTADELNAAAPESGSTWSSPINTGITVGSGTTVARYQQNGGWVNCYFKFTLAADSAITGNVNLDLPVDALFQRSVVGGAYLLDSGSSVARAGVVLQGASNQSVELQWLSDAASPAITPTGLSSTLPFTWATGDIIVATFGYFAA